MESNGQPSREALVVPVPLRSTGRARKIMEPLVRAVCGAPAQARCARCARERYCSSACQRAAWRTHKREPSKSRDCATNRTSFVFDKALKALRVTYTALALPTCGL